MAFGHLRKIGVVFLISGVFVGCGAGDMLVGGAGGGGHAGGAGGAAGQAGSGQTGGMTGIGGASGQNGRGLAGAGGGGAGGGAGGQGPLVCQVSSAGGSQFGLGGSGPVFVQFAIPTAQSMPEAITTGPDCNLWFVEWRGNKIGRITPSGTITEFAVPTADAMPTSIVAGPDGNLWFNETGANKIGRITTAGVVTELTIPGAQASALTLAEGPDGRVWFTAGRAGFIGAITAAGAFSSYPISTYMPSPAGITAGSDGALWFTNNVGSAQVDRMTVSGQETEYIVPASANFTPLNADGSRSQIIPGPDGNLWFTVVEPTFTNYIGVATPSGTILNMFKTENAGSTAGAGINSLAFGPDGNLWFTEGARGAVVRLTPTGAFTDIVAPVPAAPHAFTGITFGPDGNLWFADQASNAIWRMQPAGSAATGAGGIGGGGGSAGAAGTAGAAGAPAVTTGGPFTCGPNRLAVADFDGDGIADCVIPTLAPSSSTTVYPAFLKGTSIDSYAGTGVVTAIPLPIGTTALSTVDVSGDGRPDLTLTSIVTSPKSSLYATYLKSHTDGSFTVGSQTEFDGNANLPVTFNFGSTGDLNGDGKKDLLLAAWTNGDNVQAVSWIVVSDKGSTLVSAGFTLGGMGGFSMAPESGDLDTDGHLDVAAVVDQIAPDATVIYKGASIIYGNGDGTFGLPVAIPGSPASAMSIAGIADFNGDGKLDVAVAIGPPYQTIVTCGDGAGHFSKFGTGCQ